VSGVAPVCLSENYGRGTPRPKMIDSKPDGSGAETPKRSCSWVQRGVLAGVCALVIGLYAYAALSTVAESGSPSAADNCYSLLVQGFRAGQLSLKQEVPPGLAQLADPYDPTANVLYRSPPYGLNDLSYYNGRLYIYFGVTPALILVWPYVALTGQFLSYGQAVVIFCAMGFLASVCLLRSVWRRYFAEVSVWVVAAGALALGLATYAPFLLARCNVYEVSISCGYAFVMLALAVIWKALHEPERRGRWLLAASLAYGLAVAARPNLLFGAVILLVPVARAWRERRALLAPLLAAMVPLALIGLGLMLYNALRFDSPFEFGLHYQLAGHEQFTRQLFSLRYLWFNFRVYFLEPVGWGRRFPFVGRIPIPAVPAGHTRVDEPLGVLTNIPLVWLALAVPLAWRGRSPEARSILRWFVTAVGMLWGICTLNLCLFFAACTRYQMEFLPELMLLAAIGILSVERALLDRWVWRRAARWGWILLLGFSVTFNLLASIGRRVEAYNSSGNTMREAGRLQEAIGQYRRALRLQPDFVKARNNLGLTFDQAGRLQEAMEQYEQVLRIEPDDVEVHNNLGTALEKLGRTEDAIREYKEALRIEPDFAMANKNLAGVLVRTGNIEDAIRRYQQTLRLTPDSAETHRDFGVALQRAGRLADAIEQYQQAAQLRPDDDEVFNDWGVALERWARTKSGAEADALFTQAAEKYAQAIRIRPDSAEALNNWGTALWEQAKIKRGAEAEALSKQALEKYEQAVRLNADYVEARYNLGFALEKMGRGLEAIGHYEQALRIKPDFVQAQNALALALAQRGRLPEAIEHWEEALRIKPDYAGAHYRLGLALEQTGRVQEAIQHYEQALRIQPDFVQAQNALARLRAVSEK